MIPQTNLRYIEKKCIKHKTGVEYFYYYVRINQEHKFCTRKLKDAEEFVLRYAQKNNLKKLYR